MKRAVVLTSLLLLAAAIAIAQDAPSSDATMQHDQTPSVSSQSSASQSNEVRGCLSGSAGNFTLTDQSGTQYKLVGSDEELQAKVGHEIQVSGTQNQASETSSGNGEAMARVSNSLQVASIRDVSDHCTLSGGTNAQPTGSGAVTNDQMSPKGAPSTTEPPQPQEMAMLQQQSASPDATSPTAQNSNSSSSMSSTTTSTSQSSQSVDTQSGAATPPPVTSQTPATPASPTNSNSQMGNSPANNTGMTAGEANRDAQAARQGELNTNPNTGDTTGRGVNNQGVNNPSQTNPNATPTSRDSSTPQANNDANKPLYERQATDIPWAAKSGTTTSTTTNPQ